MAFQITVHNEFLPASLHIWVAQVLHKLNKSSFTAHIIPSDASRRQYWRIIQNNTSYILMDASQDNKSHIPYLQVGDFLIEHGFKVARVFASNLLNGWLLLEDLGEVSFNQWVTQNPNAADACYLEATNLLITLRDVSIPEFLPVYGKDRFFVELDIFCDWYLQQQLEKNKWLEATERLLAIWQEYYEAIQSLPPCIVLKDYMSDNIMWQKQAPHLALIDFQDAGVGHPLYDLASLLQDARRDVDPVIEEQCLQYYLRHTNIADGATLYYMLAIQNNMRIIGVFNRLAKRDGKNRYMRFVPRMMRYVKNNLEHKALRSLKHWFHQYGIYPNEQDYQ